MKKLLSILGALAFTASAASTVVACGNSDSSSKLKNSIDWGENGDRTVLQLPDGEVIRADHYLKDKDQLTDYLLNKVNQMVANGYARRYNQDYIVSGKSNANLGLLDANRSYKLQNSASDVNAYESEINSFNYASLSTSFYQKYVNSIISDVNPSVLDETISDTYRLNPFKFGTDTNSRSYSIWFKKADDKYTRWTTKAETKGLDIDKQYLPTPEILAGSDFILVKDIKNAFPTGDNNSLFTKVDDLTKSLDDFKNAGCEIADQNFSGQKALTYRFQSYLDGQDANSMINPFTMEYIKNNMYKLSSASKSGSEIEQATNKALYVDTTSTFVKDIQSWGWKATDKVTSNYKMVWSITLDKDTAEGLNTTINGLVDNNAENGLSTNNFTAFKSGTKIEDVFKALITGENKNLAPKGTDPLFGMSGYQGIVKDKDVVDGGKLDIDASAAEKVKDAEGFGILKKSTSAAGDGVYNFNSAKGVTQDFVIVMPIYLMDLLRSAPTASKETQADATDVNTLNNIAAGQWIELNPQSADAKWTSASFTKDAKLTNATLWNADGKANVNALPSENSFMVNDGKAYIFIAKGKQDAVTVSEGSNTITINPANASENKSGYGITGTFIDPESGKDKKAIAYNGQEVNYQIHLGQDSGNPDGYLDSWTADHKAQNIDDIANLALNKKTDLMNSLMAIEAKQDSLREEAKSIVYRSYLTLDDILYKPLYDKLKDYLKEDDTIEPSD